jgi:hypothetical protein
MYPAWTPPATISVPAILGSIGGGGSIGANTAIGGGGSIGG